MTRKGIRDNNEDMKKIYFLILLFTLSCQDNTPGTNPETTDGTETTTPSVEAPSSDGTTTTPAPVPEPAPVPAPAPTPTPTPIPTPPTAPVVTETWTEEFMGYVNDHRRSIGLRALIHNDDMGDIARIHSENMAYGKVAFGHTGFSSRCSEARAALGGGNWCGENVAAGQKTPRDAFNSWMNSSGHRANIESSRASHTGFGYAKSSTGKYYWTQIFLEH